MSGGYLDLLEKKNEVKEKQNELSWIEKENTTIQGEIKSIKSSSSYQRKLAREHLGVIGPDEYLVLFASDLAKTSK